MSEEMSYEARNRTLANITEEGIRGKEIRDYCRIQHERVDHRSDLC